MTGEWLEPAARKRIGAIVRAIEARTSAEVVVIVRARSSAHRHVDLALGAALGFAALLVYVFAPVTFNDDVAPLAIASCFAAGALLSASLNVVKRPFVRRAARREAVRLAARAAFVDQGVASTRSRRGLLVYLSLFEREADVVADVGVDVSAMGPAWAQGIAALEAAVRGGGAVEEVGKALLALGDLLATAMPVTADDVNELPDEVAA